MRGQVEIDTEAGPSEVVILADATADAGFVAADLLAQAEHGSGDETVVLVTPSRELAAEVARLVGEGRASVANRASTSARSRATRAVVLVRDLAEGVAAVNALAPEHVEVLTRGAARLARGDRGGRRLRRPLLARRGRRLRNRAEPRPADRRRGALRLAALGARLPAALRASSR